MSNTNLVSIVGAGHSGSTLLDLVLGMNTEITSVGEISNWDEYISKNKLCSCGEPTHNCDFWSRIAHRWIERQKSNQTDGLNTNTNSSSLVGWANRIRHQCSLFATALLPIQNLPFLMNILHPTALKRAANISKLFDLIRLESGSPIVCDSSKSVFRFRLMHALNPGKTKAIYLTRDGRAVAASHYRRVGKPPKASARSWRFINIYTQIMLRTVKEDTFMHVRYEELCREPEKTLKGICQFIGCPYQNGMLEFVNSSHQPHNIGGNRMRMSGLSEIREDLKWRTVFSKSQLDEFNRTAGRINARILGTYYLQH